MISPFFSSCIANDELVRCSDRRADKPVMADLRVRTKNENAAKISFFSLPCEVPYKGKSQGGAYSQARKTETGNLQIKYPKLALSTESIKKTKTNSPSNIKPRAHFL